MIRTVVGRAEVWLRSFGSWLRATGPRMRAAMVALLLVVGAGAWLVSTTVGLAGETRREARSLIDEVSALTVPQLLESDTYIRLGEQSAGVEESMDKLRSRLGLFRPLEFVPFLGGKARSARTTATVGWQVARSTRLVAQGYGRAIEQRRKGGLSSVLSVLAEEKAGMEQAQALLDEAQELLLEPLLLSDRNVAILNGSVVALRVPALVASESPRSVDDGLSLLASLFSLEETLTDPWAALIDSSVVSSEVAQVRQVMGVNYYCRCASIILAGRPPVEDAVELPRSDSWGRRTPGWPSGGRSCQWQLQWP